MSGVRIALVGAGMMANNVHYPSLTSFDDVEIVGLCDLDETRLKATAERFGISRTFTTYRAMLDETKPDAAYLLMPPHVLFEPAMDVLERGIHLFTEKPLCVTRMQAEALAQAAEQRHLITMVGFQRRYHPLFTKCHAAVTAHGPLRQVVSTFYKCMPDPTHPYYRGGVDVLTSDAVHAIDSLRYYAGGEVVDVCSVVKRLGSAPYNNLHIALVEFDNDVTGILLTNWLSGRRLLAMEFHAERAAAFADADGAAQISVNNEITETLDFAEVAGSAEDHVAQGFLAESRAFVDSIKAGRPPHNNFTDALKTWDLIERINTVCQLSAS